jgi:hypothetical protein
VAGDELAAGARTLSDRDDDLASNASVLQVADRVGRLDERKGDGLNRADLQGLA